jgi:endonuclease YncB( thermonuclease family)
MLVNVKRVIDGDTIVIEEGKVRLFGIDAPESKQVFGEESTEYLKRLLGTYSKIYIDKHGHDKYQRIIGTLFGSNDVLFSRTSATNINYKMVTDGYAWAYPQYIHNDIIRNEYVKAENEARANFRGLWRNPNPQRPGDFRAQYKHRHQHPHPYHVGGEIEMDDIVIENVEDQNILPPPPSYCGLCSIQ